MQLNIPVQQTITLPDAWQACKTPQELSYWLIAKLDVIQADIDSINEAIKEFPALQAQLSTLNESFTTLNNTVNAMNTDIGGIKDKVQENAENISGAEDRINTNSSNIAELQLRHGVYLKSVYAEIQEGPTGVIVCFRYISPEDTHPDTLEKVYSDIALFQPFPETFVEASGVYMSERGQAPIFGYYIGSNQWHFGYISAGNVGAVTYDYLTANVTKFNLLVQSTQSDA